MKTLIKLFKFVFHIPRNILIGVIWLYEKTLSPDHGPLKILFPHGYCKYHPTCSMYARGVIKKHGVFVGTLKASWRVLRCNPWSDGGNDPVR